MEVLRKIASILLAGILVFNLYGYQVFHYWLEARADRLLEADLDAGSYDETSLLSFKVPVTHLSYYNPSIRFERVEGQIEIRGIRYKYVKRRLYNDSVELLCIPNSAFMQLRFAGDEYFRLVNGLQLHTGQDKKHDRGAIKNCPLPDYYKEDVPCLPAAYSFYIVFFFHKESFFLPANYSAAVERPPETA